MKKTFPISVFFLLAAFAATSQNDRPTMEQFMGVNTRAETHSRFLRQFNTLREFHEWGLDIGYDEEECDPNPLCTAPPSPDFEANCPIQKRYGWNPSYSGSAVLFFDDLYRRFHRRFVPALKSIAPEYRGMNNYPDPAKLYEEKPLCLNGSFTYNGSFPTNTALYPSYASEQVTASTFTGYAEWMTMFTTRFGNISFPGYQGNSDDLLQNFYLPSLLGGNSTYYNCDFCFRHIEPDHRSRGDVRYFEIWNEEDQTWTDEGGTMINLDAAPTSFTRTYFYPHQYAAMLSAAYDGHLNTMQVPGAPGRYLGIKNVDPGAKVVMGGTAGLRGKYVAGVLDWCKNERSGSLPFDVLNFHHYSSSSSQSKSDEFDYHNVIQFYDGQGVHPEAPGEDLKGRLVNLMDGIKDEAGILGLGDEILGKDFWLSEFGYDSQVPENVSGVEVPEITMGLGADRQKVQAQWLTRSFLEISAATSGDQKFIQKAMIHTLQDAVLKPGVQSQQFDYSGLVRADGAPKRSWFYVLTMKYVLSGHKFIAEGLPQGWTYNTDPQSQPVRIYRYAKDNVDDQDILAIWSPTATGNSYKMTVNTGGNSILATLHEIVEWDANGRRTEKFSGSNQLTIDVSETPVFLKLGEFETDPVVLPVNNLQASTMCCSAVQLTWSKPQSYKQYVVYYGKQSELPTPVQQGGNLVFTNFYNNVIADPELQYFNVEISGGATSVIVTGLEEGVPYWFFLLPYDGQYNTPDFSTAIQFKHFTGGTAAGCTAPSGDFCIYPVTIGQLTYDVANCPSNYADVQEVLGINSAGQGCGKVYEEPAGSGWYYAQGQQSSCNTVTIDFMANGGSAQTVQAIYVRSKGANGRLLIEYELCACPGYFFRAPIIALPVEEGSILTAYGNVLPKGAIKKVRITRLDRETAVQRILFCSKDASCLNGLVDAPTVPEVLTVKDISPTTALLSWDRSLVSDADPNSPPVGQYELKLSTSVDQQGELINPARHEVEAEADLQNQIFMLGDLHPATTYYARLRALLGPEPFPCPQSPPNDAATTFTTPPTDGDGGIWRSNDTGNDPNLLRGPSELMIVPNPNSGEFRIVLPGRGFDLIQIFDMTGKLVMKKSIDPSIIEYEFDMQDVPDGIYTIRALGKSVTIVATSLAVIK